MLALRMQHERVGWREMAKAMASPSEMKEHKLKIIPRMKDDDVT